MVKVLAILVLLAVVGFAGYKAYRLSGAITVLWAYFRGPRKPVD